MPKWRDPSPDDFRIKKTKEHKENIGEEKILNWRLAFFGSLFLLFIMIVIFYFAQLERGDRLDNFADELSRQLSASQSENADLKRELSEAERRIDSLEREIRILQRKADE